MSEVLKCSHSVDVETLVSCMYGTGCHYVILAGLKVLGLGNPFVLASSIAGSTSVHQGTLKVELREIML